MSRLIEISLRKRGTRGVAQLLDELAPRTCQAVWDALPRSGQAYHGKYARNEIYFLVPAFAPTEPGPENTTITPGAGDLVYFTFQPSQLQTASHGYSAAAQATGPDGPAGGDASRQAQPIIDLAIFYERNNLLLNPDSGFVPGNVFATIVEGLEEITAAAGDMWFRGVEGEELRLARLEQ